jgi:hypothetical protein
VETVEALLAQLEGRDEWIAYLERRTAEFQSSIAELQRLERIDHQLLNSPLWKLATRLNDAAHRIAPPESSRRHLLRLGYRAARTLAKLRRREYLAQQARAFWGRARDALGAASDRLPFNKLELLGRPVAMNLTAVALPSFPRFERVDVSIVIPVYNHLRDTLACLESIKGSMPGPTYEVIVVDDGSTDGTQRTLSRIEGLVTIRNPQNEGFIGSCNRGAAVARGEHLVFLNNDTVVTNGWLDALVATFRNVPDTGLAGAKLIYPDGRLQEAGGVIWRDASGWNYGRGRRSRPSPI